jgi:hypothetical protein
MDEFDFIWRSNEQHIATLSTCEIELDVKKISEIE